MQTPQGWYNALRVVKKNIWMFLLLLIQNCAIWLMAENRFVLSFTYTKLILFLLPCNLFVCGSFELYPNGKFTKKKLRDVRILQVFTWAPFRLWWLMSLPTYKNIDIRYINKMFFFAMPGYILQLMGCYLADLVDYGSKSWILGCMSEYMSVRCASHLGKDARPCWKLKQKCLKTEIWKIGFGYFLIFRTCKNCWPGYICMSWSHLRPGHADISWPAIPICSWLYLYCIPIGQYIPEPYKLKQTCESPWLKHICMSQIPKINENRISENKFPQILKDASSASSAKGATGAKTH